MREKQLIKQAEKYENALQRRRERLEGCSTFCPADTNTWFNKCDWKTCSSCSPCPEILKRKRQYKIEHVMGCASWCEHNQKPWQSKCTYDMCQYCRPCVMYQLKKSGHRRLEDEEE